MGDLNLEKDENIIKQAENVERYQKNDKYTEIYEMYLTNKNLILVYEKAAGLLKMEDVVEKIPLSNIKKDNDNIQIYCVDDVDYGLAMQIFFTDGAKDYYIFEDQNDITLWIKAISKIILKNDSEDDNDNHEENPTSKTKEPERKKNSKATKCPNCGANIKSFAYQCPYCGTEIRNIEASSNLKDFSLGLEKIMAKKLPKYHAEDSLLKKVIGKDFHQDDERRDFERKALDAKENEIASYIKNYPIPNSREDLLEFIILTASNINPKEDLTDVVSKAWIDKLAQIYKKATITMANSSDLKEIEDIYNKKMKEIKTKKIVNFLSFPLVVALFMALAICIVNIYWGISLFLIIAVISLFIFYKLKKDDIKFLTNQHKLIYIICAILIVISLILAIIGFKYNADAHYNPNEENYYNESVDKNEVEINIEFVENIIFNRYDVELSVYDQKETLLHGKNKTVYFELPDGTHELRFENMDNNSGDTIELEVKGKTKASYKISCHTDEIKIRELSVEYE